MRSIAALLLLFTLSFANAQTKVRITNLTITEKDVASPGPDASAQLNGAEGSERVVLFSDGTFSVRTWFKVSTHKSPRSSLKDSAVNLIMELDLLENGKKKDNRRVEKIFYMDQSRTTTFTEKFVIKKGIDVRTIQVKFDATIE